jgi:protein-S-isoprenylcysteine O-methyltransferase Ste14
MKSNVFLKTVVPLAKIILSLAFVTLVFIAAGTPRWFEAWFFFGFYLIAITIFFIWLKKHDPGLLKERMSVKKDVKSWDKKIIRAYSGLVLIMFLLAPIDAVRFHWSRVPVAVQVGAFIGIFLSWVVIFWAFRENSYLSGFVRIQEDRGHKVCTTGPYKYIRHPMYLAVIITVLCLPLFLGSFYALLPATAVVALFILRTSLEDKTLRADLSGYKEYAEKVRWKLMPRVW